MTVGTVREDPVLRAGRQHREGNVSWALLAAVLVGLALALVARRSDLRRQAATVEEREVAREKGSARARLQYPHVDLSRCIGCATCVAACPEDGVLEIVHGQALVVHGARCVGHGACARECPVGGIALTFADIEQRTDLPVLSESLESSQVPGLFLAGEVTGYALVRSAVSQGTAVAAEIARRLDEVPAALPAQRLDLCIVGAGPAGLACSLEARSRGLEFVTLEQEAVGGTVAKYPRHKMVMTQPVELPLYGPLDRDTYLKEELIELWENVAREHQLPIRTGVEFKGVRRGSDGGFVVETAQGEVAANYVCLALGRRGTPRKLGVPGEELPKVAYGLLDTRSFQHRRVLVVGGGDSAVEAALGLAEQAGNEVTLSYRKHAFFRLKSRNETRLAQAVGAGRVRVLYSSQVTAIRPDTVDLQAEVDGALQQYQLPNDDVFVLAGGVPPFKLLEASGVSFDPALRQEVAKPVEQGPGLARALAAALVLGLAALAWVIAFRGYYSLGPLERAHSPWHTLLRPSSGIGLAFGAAALACMLANLAYLARRSPRVSLSFGSLTSWMTVHIATGILVLLLAMLHAGMAPADTVGGHAFWGLAVLVATGAIGRYLYSFVPHAANGRELALEEVKSQLASMSSGWDETNREFGERVRRAISDLVSDDRWQRSFVRRVVGLFGSQRRLERTLGELRRQGRNEGIPVDQVEPLLTLARRAHRSALMATHYEDLRGLLATWRYLHRWVALLMVLLIVLHVAAALRYAASFAGGGG